MTTDERRLLTSIETAKVLGVSRWTVRRWAEDGYLRAIRLGPHGHYRIPVSEVARVSEAGLPTEPTSTNERITE